MIRLVCLQIPYKFARKLRNKYLVYYTNRSCVLLPFVRLSISIYWSDSNDSQYVLNNLYRIGKTSKVTNAKAINFKRFIKDWCQNKNGHECCSNNWCSSCSSIVPTSIRCNDQNCVGQKPDKLWMQSRENISDALIRDYVCSVIYYYSQKADCLLIRIVFPYITFYLFLSNSFIPITKRSNNNQFS